MKDEYEAQMEELKQELHKERFKHVDSSASNNSGTELNGLLQAEQQKQEAHTLVSVFQNSSCLYIINFLKYALCGEKQTKV